MINITFKIPPATIAASIIMVVLTVKVKIYVQIACKDSSKPIILAHHAAISYKTVKIASIILFALLACLISFLLTSPVYCVPI